MTICDSGDGIDDNVIERNNNKIFRLLLPGISVELRKFDMLCLGGLGSIDDCSTKNKP